MRIYDTCHPEKPPSEFKVSASIADGITKLCWSTTEDNIVLIGKKSGVVEKWDTRSNTVLSPVQSATVAGGETVMDFEVSSRHGVVLVASGKKVGGLNL
jgi:WD40 repeat protein